MSTSAAKSAVKGAKSGDTDAIKAGVAKVSVTDKNEREEEGDDEDEEDGDESDDGLAQLPKKVLKRVVAIRKIHTLVEEIDVEYKKERIALEQKYLALKKPHYDARDEIVSGEVEAPIEEGAPAESSESAEEDEDEEDVDGIPGFWLQCLGAHHVTGDLIAEEDVPALEALTSIKCEYDETFSSFMLSFHFAENDYFTNTVLTKKYGVSPDLLDEKAPALTSNEGTEIDWKPSMNLTVSEIKKKQKAKSGRNKGQVRTITETVPKASFFHFFSTPTGDEEEDEDQDEDDEEGHNRIKLTMEEDYDVGHTIRTAIIPEAVLWYTGEAVDDDDEDDYDDDALYGDAEDDEDDEDDDEEDEEEDAPADKKKKKNKIVATSEGGFAAAPGAPTGGEQPECKQN